MQNSEFDIVLHHTNSKWIQDLNIRADAIKLLEGNIEKIVNTGLGKDFLHKEQKQNPTKGTT